MLRLVALMLTIGVFGFSRFVGAAPPPGTNIGCFKDTGERDLPAAMIERSNMTPEVCIAHCAAKGYQYAGVQFARQCFCGNAYGRHGPATNCTTPCYGDKAQTCGGTWANSIYAAGPSAAAGKVLGKALGCFKDASARDLPEAFFSDAGMTTERCVNHCAGKGFRYAGTQYGRQCFCGNSYGRHGPATNCTTRCAGNAAQRCGGTWANLVYSTGK